MELWNTIVRAYTNNFNYLVDQVAHPIEKGPSSFYLLILLSLFVFVLEVLFPWRKKQGIIRRDFWQDAFYMLFNYFLFNLLIFAALSSASEQVFHVLLRGLGLPKGPIIPVFSTWHLGIQFVVFFLIYDFVQWLTHNALHRIPWLWRFHKLHHSVVEMGFAAHLRYHFMENIIYRIGLYFFLSYLFHFELRHTFWLYAATTLIGHLNHANLGLDYGPLKYILNNPKMHIWHHAKELPQTHPKGMNFGLTLSIWDYLFRTNYQPFDGRDIPLGFENSENYPENFKDQTLEPFKK